MKKRIFLLFVLFYCIFVSAQETHTQWSFRTEPDAKTAKKGDIVTLLFTAKIDKHWHIFSQKETFSIPTTFTFKPNKNKTYELMGKVEEPKPIEEKDEILKSTLLYFVDKVTFKQKVKLLEDAADIKGEVEYQQCDEKQCVPAAITAFKFTLGDATKTSEVITPKDTAQKTNTIDTLTTVKKDTPNPPQQVNTTLPAQDSNGYDGNLLWFLLAAFGAGLTALLTPCVFPMIPMTVSFFTKSNLSKLGGLSLGQINKMRKQYENKEITLEALETAEQEYKVKEAKAKKHGRKDAIIYGISIVGIYVLLGAITSMVLKSSDALNAFSTSAVMNVIFFAVCVIFAISFFGAFEIVLPAKFTNFMDKKSEKSGLIGIFFMAFTLTLVSFSCTGPIVGTLLVKATQGDFFRPIMGMAAFSLAFALPFTLFAMFPQWLNKLPKSGGWLNVVKVCLGFLELALGLKFLSQADLPAHWGLLNRDVFLSLWIGIFTLMGMYLLGKIQLPHDDEVKKVPVGRFMFSMMCFCFVAYLIPGLWGAPLKPLSGILPPLHTQDFISSGNGGGHNAVINAGRLPQEQRKYGTLLHAPLGFDVYFDLDEALEVAKKENKPVIVDFTGHGCANCRRNEESVWTTPAVKEILNQKMVLVSLYVDDKTKLPEAEQKEGITTIGKKWITYETQVYKQSTQPLYVVLDHQKNTISGPLGGLTTVNEFSKFLQQGLDNFAKKPVGQ